MVRIVEVSGQIRDREEQASQGRSGRRSARKRSSEPDDASVEAQAPAEEPSPPSGSDADRVKERSGAIDLLA
jgi:hypothetical protein